MLMTNQSFTFLKNGDCEQKIRNKVVAFVVKKNITQEVPVKNYLQEEEFDTLLKEELEYRKIFILCK